MPRPPVIFFAMPETIADIPFQLRNPWEFALHGLPLRASVPFPEGAVRDPAAELALLNGSGQDVRAQWRVLSTWKDGSARFALMDYAAGHLPPRTSVALKLTKQIGRASCRERG